MISNKELSLKSSVGWTQRQEMAKKIVLKVVTGKEVRNYNANYIHFNF